MVYVFFVGMHMIWCLWKSLFDWWINCFIFVADGVLLFIFSGDEAEGGWSTTNRKEDANLRSATWKRNQQLPGRNSTSKVNTAAMWLKSFCYFFASWYCSFIYSISYDLIHRASGSITRSKVVIQSWQFQCCFHIPENITLTTYEKKVFYSQVMYPYKLSYKLTDLLLKSGVGSTFYLVGHTCQCMFNVYNHN